MENELRRKTAGSSQTTLIVIDDDEINRGILENLFSPVYAVEEAENGKEGLRKILQDPDRYCAILLDVMMPEMDGMESCKQKSIAEMKKVPQNLRDRKRA